MFETWWVVVVVVVVVGGEVMGLLLAAVQTGRAMISRASTPDSLCYGVLKVET